MLTKLGSCHHVPDLDLYVQVICKAKGEVTMQIGEDALCEDEMFEVDIVNGNCVYTFIFSYFYLYLKVIIVQIKLLVRSR